MKIAFVLSSLLAYMLPIDAYIVDYGPVVKASKGIYIQFVQNDLDFILIKFSVLTIFYKY